MSEAREAPLVMLGPGGDYVRVWPPDDDGDAPALGLPRVEREMRAARAAMMDPRTDAEIALDEACGRVAAKILCPHCGGTINGRVP